MRKALQSGAFLGSGVTLGARLTMMTVDAILDP
jgi:hypothetical protein